MKEILPNFDVKQSFSKTKVREGQLLRKKTKTERSLKRNEGSNNNGPLPFKSKKETPYIYTFLVLFLFLSPFFLSNRGKYMI